MVYTLEPASGSNNSYTGNCDVAIDGITWNITGNSQMQPWRLGGKSLSKVDRAIYSKTAISNNVTKIVITHGAASSITVNSMTVIVSTAQNGGGTVTSTLTPTFAANGDVTVNRPAGKDWSGKYCPHRTLDLGWQRFLNLVQHYLVGSTPINNNVNNDGSEVEMKTYQNGSTSEIVYADTSCTTKIGSLDPRESCDCFGIFNDRAMVRYRVGKTNNFKIGFCKWTGGVK